MPRTKTAAKKTTAKKPATACGWCGTDKVKLDNAGLIAPHTMKPTDTSTCPGTGHPPLT